MKTVHLFLATGFEEVEAVAIIDLLRRAEIDITTVSIEDTRRVVGAHGIAIEADSLMSEVSVDDSRAVVLPGGLPGATNLNDNAEVCAFVSSAHQAGRLVAAICAAPMVLGTVGISQNRRMTCYPSFESHLPGASYTADPVTVDGNVVTGKGPAFAFDFALAIIRHLQGEDVSRSVASGLLLAL